ncbi:molybdate ABC transporter substrate-binding protein [Aquisalimonas lutea]|uniref:molybdate ABC transporter substrate-binding protein n=1 Tax=Aquisalimonas lutea TaxID=1327750 RepID=UPI0025B53D7B|nr:molybdate ABC transporter substrate-binding protein [Aquisalimonas lutea]MDN3519181.1 molybdate ABC transporter substrate-binding protein [Aquisalimonas lutea]
MPAARWLRIVALALVFCAAPAGATTDVPIIAAASDLQFALEEAAEVFTERTGRRVRLNFGSSGNFRRQIAQGAPFQMYLSADESYVLALHEAGHTVDDGALYARGRIGVIARGDDPAGVVDGSLAHLRERLESNQLRRFAIADPEHAPYGRAARQALEAAGLWEAIQPYLILGENVSQATRFALSEATDGGIVAYSLARAPTIAERSSFALIPEERHEPLRQRMVLMRGAGETAAAFYEFMQTDTARDILADYGFVVPEGNG